MGNLNKYFGYIITLVGFPLWIYYGFQLWIFYCQSLQHWLGEVIGFIASIIFIPGLILFPFLIWFIEGVFPTLYFQLFLKAGSLVAFFGLFIFINPCMHS